MSQAATNPRNPFTPASTTVNSTSPSQSDRPVTLPHIPELYFPLEQVFDALLPPVLPPANAPAPPPAPTLAEIVSNPLLDAIRINSNRTTTWNNAPAYKSTFSPTLDAFASLSQATDKNDIRRILSKSWAADPAVTLRIIWNLRSIHEGKSAREQFYCAYGWLYANHPRTAIANLRYLVESTIKRTIKPKAPAVEDEEDAVMVSADPENSEDTDARQEVEVKMPHGYWKDLLNILLLATLNQLEPTSALSALHIRTPKGDKQGKIKGNQAAVRARDAIAAEQAKLSRLEKHRTWHKTVSQKLSRDKKYRALYITVARLFADGLARDVKILQEIADAQTSAKRRVELSFELTMVGKWAPTVGGSHDRVTSIATPIAELLYAGGYLKLPVEPLSQPLTTETAHRLRIAYTRWITSPLRRILKVPEVAMSAGQWDKIHYARVPSHCMSANKKLFIAHDKERFSTYLQAVAQGKSSISGGTLLPHELLLQALASSRSGNDPEVEVIEAQWNSLVERVREAGVMPNALALCDVSGSMGFLGGGRGRKGSRPSPIAPAVALSMILAKVARPPWADVFITFSAEPELITLDPTAGLVDTANKMTSTSWGYNTDFNAVFTKLILPTAVEHKVRPEDMVQRLFVFSDMQFDESRQNAGRWESEHGKIKREFERAGYVMPEIVYWNLAGDVAKPVTQDEEGVALVSGFSPGMLKVFLESGGVEQEVEAEVEEEEMDGEGEDAEYGKVGKVKKKPMDPVDTMLKALGKESYAGLQVFD